MSTADKPDPDRAARFFADLVIDGEAERIANLSDEEYIAEVKRKGGDPADEMSVEDLLARVRTLAAQKGAAVAPSPGAPEPAATPESPAPPGLSVAPNAPAPAEGRVVPLRRSRGLFWGSAAAFAAAIAGIFVLTGPGIVASFHKPTPREKAEMMRDEAIGNCERGSFRTCRQLLDEAQRLDPGGESEERVRKARDAIDKGVYPGPVVPEGPGR